MEIKNKIKNGKYLTIDNNTPFLKNMSDVSLYFYINYSENKYYIFHDVNLCKKFAHRLDDAFGKVVHLYHHGITPHERTGYKNLYRLAPNIGYKFNSSEFFYFGENKLEEAWDSSNVEKRRAFVEDLSYVTTESNAEAILFSGGIDSLLLTLLDKEKRELIHFNNDPIQRIIAEALAKKINRPIKIIEIDENSEEALEKSLHLRNLGVGHYLPWNNAASYSNFTVDKTLISGQHADTLLMVDTFAPGINSHGIYWYYRMLKTMKDRAPYCKESNDYISKRKSLDNIIDDFEEHAPLRSKMIMNEGIIQNKTARTLNKLEVKNHSDFVYYSKMMKIYRFCINSNRIYTDGENLWGYKRDLIYFNKKIKKHLLSYIPSFRDLYYPKSLFYDAVRDLGIDYYSFKRQELKNIVNMKYFIKRFQDKRKHHQSDIALSQIDWHLKKLGFQDLGEMIKDQDLKIRNISSKKDLMKIDRRLNYLQYIK